METTGRFSGNIISGNRVTIDYRVMEDLGLKVGDRVEVIISRKSKLKEGMIL